VGKYNQAFSALHFGITAPMSQLSLLAGDSHHNSRGTGGQPVLTEWSESRMTAARSIDLTQVNEWNDGHVHPFQDYLVAEEPLEIRANGQSITVTMRTPGHDLELTAGFLFTEGLIRNNKQLINLRAVPGKNKTNIIEAHLEKDPNFKEFRRNFAATSSCGICGKISIESVRLRGLRRPDSHFAIDPEVLCALPEKLHAGQAVFGRTGGLHAAAIFNRDGELLVLREDIGRHNAVDKVVGWALQKDKLPLSESVMMVSGRGGFEIIQKALAAGVPALASVSAPSGLAVQLAREFGMTLIGFLRGRRFVIYSEPCRITTLT
jgi:FdhD protein